MFFKNSGAGVFGHLSDSTLGRRGSLTVVCVLNAVFGCLTALSPSYLVYAVLRLLTGFSTGGVGLCAFVLATEPVGPTKRGLAGMSTFYFFSTGIAILAAVAYAFPSWRHLYVASSLPSLLFVLLVVPFLSESPRWHVVRGRFSHAMQTMHAIAAHNGRKLPRHKEKEILMTVLNIFLCRFIHDTETEKAKTVKDDDNDSREEAVGGSVIDVLRSSRTRKRLALAVGTNFLCSVVYYGLSLNVVNLKTNLYFNVVLNAVAEMPAFFLTAVMIDRLGRKPLLIGTMWFSGVFCVLGTVLGPWKRLRMLCGVLGIFGMAGTYNLLFIYTMELFPTVVRNAALGCATQAAQMGAILSPFVVVLGGGFPFMVFSACGLVGGALAFCLPETLNRPLYDTMAGLEEGESKILG
ncbi:hypothetical protein V2J09_017568 [Rumex salicifolius]